MHTDCALHVMSGIYKSQTPDTLHTQAASTARQAVLNTTERNLMTSYFAASIVGTGTTVLMLWWGPKSCVHKLCLYWLSLQP